jgi:hypothetical protein
MTLENRKKAKEIWLERHQKLTKIYIDKKETDKRANKAMALCQSLLMRIACCHFRDDVFTRDFH